MRQLLPVLFVCVALIARDQDKPVSWSVGFEIMGQHSCSLCSDEFRKHGSGGQADTKESPIGFNDSVLGTNAHRIELKGESLRRRKTKNNL